MSKKQLLIAFFSLVILACLSIILLDNDWAGAGSGIGDPVLQSVPVNEITKIQISGKQKSATLQKTDGVWQVVEEDGYPADFQKISLAVIKLRDLKVAKVINAKPKAYGRLQLDSTDKSMPPVVVSCFDKSGGKVAELSLGKEFIRKNKSQQMMPYGNTADGRYVLAKDAPKPVLVSDTLNDLSDDSFAWVDRSFVSIGKVKTMTLTKVEKQLWQISRDSENGKFKLVSAAPEGKEPAEDSISSVSNAFNYIYFEDVKKSVEPKAEQVMTITTFDGFTYIVAFHKVAVDYFVNVKVAGKFSQKRSAVEGETPEDAAKLDKEFAENLKKLNDKLANEQKFSGWFYKLSVNKVESMLKTANDLTKYKEPEKKDDAPAQSAETNK